MIREPAAGVAAAKGRGLVVMALSWARGNSSIVVRAGWEVGRAVYRSRCERAAEPGRGGGGGRPRRVRRGAAAGLLAAAPTLRAGAAAAAARHRRDLRVHDDARGADDRAGL